MQFAGVLPEDAPYERKRQLKGISIPIFELAHQTSVSVADIGVSVAARFERRTSRGCP